MTKFKLLFVLLILVGFIGCQSSVTVDDKDKAACKCDKKVVPQVKVEKPVSVKVVK